MADVTIREIRAIPTAPDGINLLAVKVETSEPGLYGLGCATFTQRWLSVRTTLEQYLSPLLKGRPVANITDIWRLCCFNSYWRGDSVLNNALAGVDTALWDIKGKLAGLPLYELLGGKCREAGLIYGHAFGSSPEEVIERIIEYRNLGYQYVRCQQGFYGGENHSIISPRGALPGAYYSPDQYIRITTSMFNKVRDAVGFDLELIHDVHERISPQDAVRFAKMLEDCRLFYLEDLLAPEDIEWIRVIREHSTTPLAIGELFNNSAEWMPLISGRVIDFIRVHISHIGGITPAHKLAMLADSFGVRIAWHGPRDITPIGHAANLHLDLASPNFGIREWFSAGNVCRDVFPGCPILKGGYAYPNLRPGLGVDIDEKLAGKFPCDSQVVKWTQARLPDGSVSYP